MHVRFSTVVGLGVVDEIANEEIAFLSGILIQPDLGKIEGFYVRVPGFLRSEELFLSVIDIVHWGNRVRVRDENALTPLEDVVRMQALASEGRTVIHQKIITESGMPLGMCRDVQFDTVGFYLEWIFPRSFWRWKDPIPASSIVLVRPDAVVVRDAVTLPETAKPAVQTVINTLDPLGAASSRVVQRKI